MAAMTGELNPKPKFRFQLYAFVFGIRHWVIASFLTTGAFVIVSGMLVSCFSNLPIGTPISREYLNSNPAAFAFLWGCPVVMLIGAGMYYLSGQRLLVFTTCFATVAMVVLIETKPGRGLHELLLAIVLLIHLTNLLASMWSEDISVVRIFWIQLSFAAFFSSALGCTASNSLGYYERAWVLIFFLSMTVNFAYRQKWTIPIPSRFRS